MEDFASRIIHEITSREFATQAELQGCTDEEITSYMAAQGVTRLPEVYIQFLKAVGKNAGKILWKHELWKEDDLKEIKKHLIKEFEHLNRAVGESLHLPPDAFVFRFYGMDIIAAFYFLTNNDDDDPPIYVYFEVEYKHEQDGLRLSEFLLGLYSY